MPAYKTLKRESLFYQNFKYIFIFNLYFAFHYYVFLLSALPRVKAFNPFFSGNFIINANSINKIYGLSLMCAFYKHSFHYSYMSV